MLISLRIVYLVVTAIPFHAFRNPLKAPREGLRRPIELASKNPSLIPLTVIIYSTVTDLAKFRGKSTLSPSPTASQYAMS